MTTVDETVEAIAAADTWDKRVGEIRLIPERHGKGEHSAVFAAVARELYVPYLAPDFAFIHDAPFYDDDHFGAVYAAAESATNGFTKVGVDDLAALLDANSQTLLVFRTITGLLKNEFASTTTLVAEQLGDGSAPISPGTVDGAEKRGSKLTPEQARVLAHTIDLLVSRQLFSDAPPGLHSKQDKLDTRDGWDSVRQLATNGVPYQSFLHQRHYGGSFGQVTNATSGKKGDLLEDEVEDMFKANGVPYIRTGSHNQGEIATRFGVTVKPAPDFVVFDASDALRGMLECKSTNDGGTARDKATRFRLLQAEGTRLGGVPVLGVLGGTGWARVNDTLGPVLQYTDGRVFTIETLDQMLTVQPFPQLVGLASDS
ncbi:MULTISPECIES: hypothetical protein [Mycobacterium avium complex (MAC)]|uniref:Restriction endonuclease n=1 Tax=Mycobacterium timonense TaxID=701043 RepID=A0ABX3TSJ2_9MYCO|nr:MULTISPECIES: hypothetical protein [Mycobacterium avium complex (MAC)]ETB35825.1 hypothetical protein N602_25855 [Mycobacterium avium subsp. hominissuis 10-5606]MBZ4500206.1 hypothetical protein [Mycobacterium avium subsp. hominissuis]MBZ4547729.1 hypothetical protein [Mycobacterium avium subsp. hominissuis]MBZ4600386.1 hypothetical protein [Mycobacterium avium subsp. hominissuis]MDO2397606.1 hypothetical protein [Mycobacterium avium subsp. hominissuis]